tara:strand:+ start:1733 stop:1840 length:108 start_codon:yes stop_codon:yes gene_type:complete
MLTHYKVKDVKERDGGAILLALNTYQIAKEMKKNE